MSGIILHFNECKPGSTLASARIVRYLERRYGFEVMDRPDANKTSKEYDYALLVSSASGFADPVFREQIGEICARAKRYVFVQNDYMTTQAGQVYKWFDRISKPRARVVWSTIPSTCVGHVDTYVNWNMLTWAPQPVRERKHEDVLYYGAHRRDRIPYFQRYLATDLYPVTISSSLRVEKKWCAIAPRASLIAPFADVIEEAGAYPVTIYMEDGYSHRHYCSPANRFYEGLSAGCLVLFDENCRETFKRAGIDIEPWVVNGPDQVITHLRDHYGNAMHQRIMIGMTDYAARLEEAVQVAEQKVGLSPCLERPSAHMGEQHCQRTD